MNVTSMITRKSFLVLWSSMKNSRWTLLTLRIKFFIDKTNQKDDQENLKSVKNQEFEKSPKEIIRAKKGTKLWRKTRFNLLQSGSTYFKVDLEEFDLKSALFSHMNKKKPANKNTANYHLYHALMEALIADEDAMDKEVADKVKDHKRKHDSDDDEAMMMMRPFQLDQPGFRSKQRKEDLILPLLGIDGKAQIGGTLTTLTFPSVGLLRGLNRFQTSEEETATPEPELTIPQMISWNQNITGQIAYATINTMAKLNVPAQPPTRTDEQIIPRSVGAGVYSCQVDEQWFDLSADLLRKALAITPVIPAQPFELPPSGNTVIDFVNELGYPEPVEIERLYRRSDKPRHPVLQMLWGIVTQTNVDHAELIWEEFTQGIQTFFSHKASHNASLKNPKKKVTPLLIPYGRFSKVIIYYLASNNNIHRRPESAVHHTGDDFILGNLKFVPKGESVEVFGMAIPDPLITEAIQQSSYYPKYLEMVAENTKKTPQESASVQPATQRATPKKHTTTTPVKQSKPAPPPTKKPSKHKLPQKVRKGKPSFQTFDEDDEVNKIYSSRRIYEQKVKQKPHASTDPDERHMRLGWARTEAYERDQTWIDSGKTTCGLCWDKTLSTWMMKFSPKLPKVTDKVDLEEFDLKSALFKHMNKIKSANRNTANYHLYHALMEALIAYEDAMDKEVADKTDHSPESIFLETENNNWAEIHTPATYKFMRKTSFKGRRMNWVISSMVLQTIVERRSSAKLIRRGDMSNPEGHQILRNIYEPLPLGGPPGQRRKYDISAGLWHHSLVVFRRKGILHNILSEPSDREAVRSQMRILSVISVKVFEKYEYNYLREIILRRADYQGRRNRVVRLQLGIESYQTKINLERPNWDATDYYFKEDYTIVPKPRAVVYRDRNDQRKLMRLNELHKFSDGTLTRVMEKLDHMVKDFHLFEYNKGMETRKWSEDDKRRSKDFITAIEKRLQIRRIYRSLESFVGGRIRDIDYRLINKTT
ncbi:hypothetical protein Tco_0078846 [Tanacetum coccineum]